MKLFFFDTETTGLDPKYDYIIQFGGIFGDYNLETGKFREEETINWYINVPKQIPASASAIHHIYNKDLEGYDKFNGYAERLLGYFKKSDYAIAHNVEFDKNMVIHEFERNGIKFDEKNIEWIDTMKPMTQFVRARRKNGLLKYPKLTELYQYLFGKTFEGAHDALNDIRATKECFLYILKNFNIFTLTTKNTEIIYEKEGLELGNGYIYYGKIINGKPQGKGKVYNNHDGELVYEGEFEKGLYEGLGKIYYNGKLEYEGEFKGGIYNGKGKQYYDNTLDYEGDFVDGNFDGKGKQYFINGNLQYEGEFKGGRYEGQGVLYNDDGTTKYEGRFVKGYPEKVFKKKIEKLKNKKIQEDLNELEDDLEEELDNCVSEEEYLDKICEYEDMMSYKEASELQNAIEKQDIKKDKYERIMPHRTIFEDEPDDEDDFYNQTYDEDDDVTYVPHKS